MRRFRVDMKSIHRSSKLYLAMQKATTEAEYQNLLVEMDAVQAASRQGPFGPRTLAEFPRGPMAICFSPWKNNQR